MLDWVKGGGGGPDSAMSSRQASAMHREDDDTQSLLAEGERVCECVLRAQLGHCGATKQTHKSIHAKAAAC